MTNIALSASISSLLLLEKQMGVASNNISNANTVGYTAETEQVSEQVTDGVGTGVNDLGTVDNVDAYLQASVLQSNTTSTQATTFNSYYQELQQAFGQITTANTGGNDLSSQIATLQATLSQLGSTPTNTSLGNQAIGNLQDLTANFRGVSQQIQTLRSNADQAITSAVTDANTQLNIINGLNTQIETAQATNQPTASLNDQRTQALQSLSADLGVSYYINANGAMQITTTSGQSLLTGNVVTELSHSSVSISDKMSYPSGGIGGIMVGGQDITGAITQGKIASLVQMRDTELPNAQNALNYMAQNFAASLNAASNQGSASPPPSSLTSASPASYQLTDAVTPSANLTVRIALVDSSGEAQTVHDVNLSGAATVNDVVNDINAAFGSTVASVTNGQLSLTSPTSGQGIAVSTLSGTLTGPAGGSANATDFSSFFHLNDVVTGGSAELSAATISVNPAMLANSSLLPVGSLNNTQPAPTVPFSGVGAGDGSTAQAMSQALLTSQTFTTGTATGTTTFGSATDDPNVAGNFVITGGSSDVQVTVTQGETLSQIAASINSAAGSSGVVAQVVGNGIYQLQITSGSNRLNFTDVSGDVLSGLGISGTPTGYLGAATTTFGGFASNLISDVASRASTASTEQTSQSTTLTALQTSLSNQSGVNVDQQTAQLSSLQNLYAASARVITTVNAMFNALITAVEA